MKRINIVIAAVLAVTATPTLAASSASASLTNFTFSLVDLDLADGITPTLTWLNTGYTQASETANDPLHSNFQNANQQDMNNFAPLSGSVTTLLSQASVATTGNTLITANLQTDGSAQSDDANYNSDFQGEDHFTLSANTQVTFSAFANIQASTTVGFDGVSDERAQALAFFYADNFSFTLGHDISQVITGFTIDPITGFNIGETVSDARLLSFSISNTDVVDLNGRLRTEIYTNGYSNIAAVPEPETYVMLLAGLGLIGFSVKRRKMN